MINTVRADFEVKNHQYALTKIVQIVRLNRFDTVYGHLNTFSFSCISVCCKQGDHRPQPPSKWDRVTMQVWTKHFSSVTAHKQVILGCEEIYFFLGLSLSWPKKSDPQRHLLAIWLFPPACPNWACFGGSRKKRPGKKSGDMLVLLVTMGDPSIAGYLRVWQRRYRRGTTLRHRTLTTYQATWR